MTAGTWMQQQYAAQHSPPPQKGPQGGTFHHKKMAQVNSLNKQEENKHMRKPLWQTTHPKTHVHKFSCEADTRAWCSIMPLYIYRSIFRDMRPEPPMMTISGYGESLVANTGLCTAVFITGYQAPRKAVFQVTDTIGYLILGKETVRKIGYIPFLKITQAKLTQQSKTPAHLKAIKAKMSRQEAASEKHQTLRCLRVQLLYGAVLINGKRHTLPIMKEYALKEYNDVFSGVGTLSRNEYHITLKENYVLVQDPQD